MLLCFFQLTLQSNRQEEQQLRCHIFSFCMPLSWYECVLLYGSCDSEYGPV